MLTAVADTHAIVWYIYDDPRLTSEARDAFESAARDGDHVGFSSISLVELIYLVEKRRIRTEALERLFSRLDQPNAVLIELPFERSTAMSLREIDRNQVPDMPDRIIAATASLHGVPLISRDRRVVASNVPTIW